MWVLRKDRKKVFDEAFTARRKTTTILVAVKSDKRFFPKRAFASAAAPAVSLVFIDSCGDVDVLVRRRTATTGFAHH
jgi:hypothetical protein